MSDARHLPLWPRQGQTAGAAVSVPEAATGRRLGMVSKVWTMRGGGGWYGLSASEWAGGRVGGCAPN